MSVTKRAVKSVSVLILVSMVLMACAPSPAPQQAASTSAAEASQPAEATTAPAEAAPVTINVWTRMADLEAYFKGLAEDYHDQNPNVTVNVTLFDQRAMDEKLAIALPTGEGADVIESSAVTMWPYHTQGFLVPAPPDLREWAGEHLAADVVAEGTDDDGELYAVPFTVLTQAMFYNKDMFEEAGLECCPEDLDELAEYATKLTKYDDKGNITRAGLDLRLGGGGHGIVEKYWAMVMIPYGCNSVVPVDGKWTAGYANECGKASLQFYLDALYKHRYDSPEVKSDAEGFGLGATAMFQRESWVIGYLKQNAPDINFGTFLMPKGPGGWGTTAAGSNLTVTKVSKNQDVAWDFIKFVLNEENQVSLLETTGWIPVRTDVDYSAIFEEEPAFKAFLDSLSTPGFTGHPYPRIEPILEINGKIADRLVQLWSTPDLANDPATIEKELEAMAKETNRILDDYGLLAE